MKLTVHPAADAEVTEAVQYYEAHSPGRGADLLEQLEAALRQIAAFPESCQLIGRRVRRKPLQRFPYSLIYAVHPDRVRIMAFAHQKRHPYYWRKRLRGFPATAS